MPAWLLPVALAGLGAANLYEQHKGRKAAEADAEWRRKLAMRYLGQAEAAFQQAAPLRNIGLQGVARQLAGMPGMSAFTGARGEAGGDPFAALALLGYQGAQPSGGMLFNGVGVDPIAASPQRRRISHLPAH